MALQVLDIYKHLPKTNCKECGLQTCLAFAMQLATQKVKLEQCPYVSEDGKKALSAQSRPAIKLVKIGDKEIGNETVIFRHEKTFCHETLICFELPLDTETENSIKLFNDAKFERVGQELMLDLISIKFSGNKEKFTEAVNIVLANTKAGIILDCDDKDIMNNLTANISGKGIIRPNKDYEEFAKIAKEHNLAIVVSGSNLEEIAENVGKVLPITEEIIIEVNLKNFRKNVEALTEIRQIAVKHKFRNLGFPTLAKAGNIAEAAAYLTRYASIVIIDKIDNAELLPLLTLRQNIFTDPQNPLQVDPGIYPIGAATEKSPVLVTTNFSLTYFTVSNEISSTKVPAHLLVVDTEGMSVLTGFAADKFTPEIITKAMNNFNIAEKVDEKKIVIPGLVAKMSGTLEEESNWKVIVGPRQAKELRKFMHALK